MIKGRYYVRYKQINWNHFNSSSRFLWICYGNLLRRYFLMINMIIQVLAAGFASLGFAILYNVKGRKIWVSFFGGILTWGLYLILYKIFHQDVICYFLVTSFITSMLSWLQRIFKTPTTYIFSSSHHHNNSRGGLYRTIAALWNKGGKILLILDLTLYPLPWQ